VYVVRAGDSLTGIARDRLGDAGKWRRIATANGVDQPDRIHVGQRLRIPAQDESPAGRDDDERGTPPSD
jgi:nucleoid-associated protein YgaU